MRVLCLFGLAVVLADALQVWPAGAEVAARLELTWRIIASVLDGIAWIDEQPSTKSSLRPECFALLILRRIRER
jgi:hypothetical protein